MVNFTLTPETDRWELLSFEVILRVCHRARTPCLLTQMGLYKPEFLRFGVKYRVQGGMGSRWLGLKGG